MFEKTFKKLGEVTAALEDELKDVFKRPTKEDLEITSVQGHIQITGTFKSLTINGQRVQFKFK